MGERKSADTGDGGAMAREIKGDKQRSSAPKKMMHCADGRGEKGVAASKESRLLEVGLEISSVLKADLCFILMV